MNLESDFGKLRKEHGVFVYDLPKIRGWHANSELKPVRGKTFAYFGYNWWDLMASGILQDSKYVGKGTLGLNLPRDDGPGYVLINCSSNPRVITNRTSKNSYHLPGYTAQVYNKSRKTSGGIRANNTLVAKPSSTLMQQVRVGDAIYILVGIEDLLNKKSSITKTPLYNDFMLACGIINPNQYYSTTGLNAFLSRATREGKKIEVDDESSMMDWVNTISERWEFVNPTKRLPPGKSIPRKIHWIWLSRVPGTPNPLKSKFFKFMKSWVDRNPNSEYFLWTDSSDPGLPRELEDAGVEIMYEDDIYDLLNRLPKESKKGAINMIENHPNVGSRADTLRQCILYLEGGIYADVNDMACLIPMEAYMDHFDFMAGMEPMLYVNNAFVAAAPGHIIVKNFLLFIAERSDEFIDDWDPNEDVEEKDNLVVSQTGPIAFSSIINGVLNDDDEYMEELLPRTCIFPSKFVYSNYEIPESPLSWISPVSQSAHFDNRDYLK